MKIKPEFATELLRASLLISLLLPATLFAASNTQNFTAAPPFVATDVGKPNVVIALDISGSMKAVAYRDVSAGKWSNTATIHDDFNPVNSYFGYFESDKKYSYSTASSKRFFYESALGSWDGNFLNWLAMRRMDVVRKVLVGGKVRDRNGELIDGDTWYVIEGQNEPFDRTFRKSYSDSSSYSPYPDNAEILIAEGVISLNSNTSSKVIPLSDKVEMGQVSIDRNSNLDDDLNEISNWHSVTFTNAYTQPIVVVNGLSFNGSQQVHARVRNISAIGFEIRLEEWDYMNVNHSTEQVTYLVAEGNLGATNIVSVDGVDYEVRAGSINLNNTLANGVYSTYNQALFSSYTPSVFTGVSSQNSNRPVISRVRNVSTSGFEVTLQNEEGFFASAPHPANEDVHWIAIEPFSGILDYPLPGAGAAIEVGNSGGNTVTQNWYDINFSALSGFFSSPPILAVNAQTINGSDTAYPRYRNLGATGFQVKSEEEKSSDTEVTHVAESMAYIAVESISGYNVRLGVLEEPVGVVQQNSGSLRFGLNVYNYDHSLDPTDIYDGNVTHGGTFWPCYPDINVAVGLRSNYDICLDTHVKSPLSNIIDVIEDHPLIWGTTPIAESLYEIEGYFKQTNHSRNSHNQWYDNGTEGGVGLASDGYAQRRNSYEVSDAWDPYYYDEVAAKLPCAKSFVLHFNDGAPYKDFDGSGHPTITNDGVGPSNLNEALDDIALNLRENDCRSDTGMTGHQEIVSYYVYAALGEDEANNTSTRRMREAAANGGFVDADEDLSPDPMHPADFITYVDSAPCTANEWDKEGDCNPDTFYFANDGAALVDELNSAFQSIVTRAATGGASSVISASRSGEGNVVNAIFRPFAAVGSDEVKWIGDVHALMIDSEGNIRQDDGDKVLEAATSDKYLDMCSNSVENIVRVKTSTSAASRPTSAQFTACSDTVFNLDLFDIDYLWSGSEWLANLTDVQATSQRTYISTLGGRYIISGIDSNSDGLVNNSEQVSFLASSFPEEYAGLLADTVPVSEDIINFIRGQDISGYRSRQLDGKTMRLGDVIYSTPTIVGRPAENLDLIYESTSYKTFLSRYINRRQMVYAGGNDGMLHAFNGGWYDSETKEFHGAKGGSTPGSSTDYDLGAELWAYVPYNGLRHLEYLTDTNYGLSVADHVYFMDQKPRVFDAKIFTADTDHPGGWGTVLVVGMRLGGGETTMDIDLDAVDTDSRTLTSSYSIFDITNPDVAPKLLLEFTHADLGFTTSTPAPIVSGTDAEGNGNWYLLLGSGADRNASGFDEVKSTQTAKLFLLNLKAVATGVGSALESSFGSSGVLALSDANSFISDIVPVDFGVDNFTTDAVYFGTVSGDASAWGGKLYRMVIQENTGDTPKAVSTWAPSLVHDAGEPVTAAVSLAVDNILNKWLYFGTGRYFTSADNLDNSVNYYYGLKEPRNTSGVFGYSTISSTGLADISSVAVEIDSGELDPAPTLSPALATGATVDDLENRLKQYSNSSNYQDGWRRTLSAGERNFGSATLLGGTLSYTTFDPLFDECAIEGDSSLYVVNAITGTADDRAILVQGSGATHYQYVVDLGSSPATSPSLHRGEGYSTDNKSTAIIQAADGNIISIEQDNKDKVRDGEASWRQLQ